MLLGIEPCPTACKIDEAKRLCLLWAYGRKDAHASQAVTGAGADSKVAQKGYCMCAWACVVSGRRFTIAHVLQGAVEFLQDQSKRSSNGAQERQLDVCRQTARVRNFGADGVKSTEEPFCAKLIDWCLIFGLTTMSFMSITTTVATNGTIFHCNSSLTMLVTLA